MTDKPSKHLKILIIGNLAPHRIGGAEVQAWLLARSFARRGNGVMVAGYANPDGRLAVDSPHRACIESVRLRSMGSHRTLRAISYALSLGRFIMGARRRFDVVLCYMLGESDLVLSLLKQLKLINQPTVICSAGFGRSGDAARLKALPFSSTLVGMLKRQSNAINIISPKIEEELAQLGLGHLFTHIPNGVSLPDDCHIAVSAKTNIRSFLFAGRLVRLKGCADLIEAVRLLNGAVAPFNVNIVGDGPQFGTLRELARKSGVSGRVTFHGAVPPHRMADHYCSNSILVLPSHREAQGLVVAEAMSFGLPVIVTRSGGPEYTVDESMARLCPKRDPAALAGAMREMLDMPEKEFRAMGRRARRHVQEKYDIEKVADRFIGLFHRLRTGT